MRSFTIFLVLCGVALVFSQPNIIITEIMQNPDAVSDANGEWFEIYNAGNSDVNINGWTIKDNDTDSHVIDNGGPLIISAGGFLVLGNNKDSGTNGNLTVNYQYSGITLANGDDEIVLLDGNGVEVDRVEYDGGPNWPDPKGASMVFIGSPSDDNNDYHFWTEANLREPSFVGTTGDKGSPGTNGADQSLPVTLSSFNAAIQKNAVLLKWRTESEVGNLGFEIYRAQSPEDDYQLLSSYRDNLQLKGQFNSSDAKVYKYFDYMVKIGAVYYYKLADVSVNGEKTFHGPLKVLVQNNQNIKVVDKSPTTFKLYPSHPNPFNPSTDIVFDLPTNKQNILQAHLDVYNCNGQKVRTLLNTSLQSGKQYQIHWDGKSDTGATLPAGIYFAVLHAGQFQQSIKMCMVK